MRLPNIVHNNGFVLSDRAVRTVQQRLADSIADRKFRGLDVVPVGITLIGYYWRAYSPEDMIPSNLVGILTLGCSEVQTQCHILFIKQEGYFYAQSFSKVKNTLVAIASGHCMYQTYIRSIRGDFERVVAEGVLRYE